MSKLKRIRGRAGYPVFLLAVLPLALGCSTLGIATTSDLEEAEARMQNTNRATGNRVQNIERDLNNLQQTVNQTTSQVDTLNTRFARARKWLETMDLDTISQDAQDAITAAEAAERRTLTFSQRYLDLLRAQRDLLVEEIQSLETKMKAGDSGGMGSSPAESPAGGDEEGDDGDDSEGDEND